MAPLTAYFLLSMGGIAHSPVRWSVLTFPVGACLRCGLPFCLRWDDQTATWMAVLRQGALLPPSIAL